VIQWPAHSRYLARRPNASLRAHCLGVLRESSAPPHSAVNVSSAARAQSGSPYSDSDQRSFAPCHACTTALRTSPPQNVLFADGSRSLLCRGRHAQENTRQIECGWAIESDGGIIASGGLLFHYNPPYGDVFMEVEERYRQQGFGSYLVEELKRVCYENGEGPRARCDADNAVSRRTLEKAGMLPSGRVLQATLRDHTPYTLNLKSSTSPSATTYSFPSIR